MPVRAVGRVFFTISLQFLSPSFQESDGGLYICMNTFLGFGKQYVEKHYQKTGQRVYLHLKRTRKPVKNKNTCLSTLSWAVPLCSVRVFRPQMQLGFFRGELRYSSSSALPVLNRGVDCPWYCCRASSLFRVAQFQSLRLATACPSPLNILLFLLNETEGRRHQLQCWGPPKEETNSLGYW